MDEYCQFCRNYTIGVPAYTYDSMSNKYAIVYLNCYHCDNCFSKKSIYKTFYKQWLADRNAKLARHELF